MSVDNFHVIQCVLFFFSGPACFSHLADVSRIVCSQLYEHVLWPSRGLSVANLRVMTLLNISKLKIADVNTMVGGKICNFCSNE